MTQKTNLHAALQSRLRFLKLRYPGYSLRAFAKKADVSPTTMSLILAGRRTVSRDLAEKLCERLNFEPSERALVLSDFHADGGGDTSRAENANQLAQDQYCAISDWRAFALLNLIETRDFRSETGYIAQRLGITESEVQEILDMLLRLKMICLETGEIKRSKSRYNTTDDIANAALKRSHEETLELAASSLEKDTVEARDFSWLTVPVDPKKLGGLKKLIHQFQEDVYKFVSDNKDDNEEVYRLAVQLFPLSHPLKEKPQ